MLEASVSAGHSIAKGITQKWREQGKGDKND